MIKQAIKRFKSWWFWRKHDQILTRLNAIRFKKRSRAAVRGWVTRKERI